MSLKNQSKRAFADAFERLLETTPINKIRVTALAKKVKATPQAFYYHFQDKYDLAAWIYLQDYASVISDRSQNFSSLQIMRMMMTFNQRKSFYKKAFTDKSQNAIEDYAIAHNMRLVRSAVTKWQGSPITIEQEMAVLYHQYAVMGLFKDWIFDRLPIDSQQLAQLQYDKAPDFLKEALTAYQYDSIE